MSKEYHRNALKPGHRIQWYEIKEILGQGGFGITYLAHDTNLDQQVAIKEYLPIELAVRESDDTVQPATGQFGDQYQWGLERFIAEAQTLAKFKHPNIVRVFSVFEENNTAYMIMEYEQGDSLQDLIRNKKTLDETELARILFPILDGLEQVHAAGFIHRDIKPANIFIRKDGSPVLLDFGSARQAMGVEAKTLTTLVTPGFAPIEQYYSKSDEQGPWTDIYSLAATVYRAVCGVVPLDAVDRSKSLLERSEDTFVGLEEISRGHYSERFLKAIDHGLKFKQQERPQTILEWKSDFDLGQYQKGIEELKTFEEAATQPAKTIKPTPVAAEKKSALPFVPIIVAILIAIASGAYFFLPQQSKTEQSIETKIPSKETVAVVSDQPKLDADELLKQQLQAEREQIEAEKERLRQQQALFEQQEAERKQAEEKAETEQQQALLEQQRLEMESERKKIEEEKQRIQLERQQLAKQEEARQRAALKAEAAKKEQEQEALAKEKAKETARQHEIQQCLAQQVKVGEPNRLNADTLYYAVIAVGKNNGWGEAWGYDNQQEAEQVAMQGCSQNDQSCKVEVWSNNCVALATDKEGAVGWARGDSLNQARDKAINFCQAHSPCCQIQTAFCADEIE